MIANLLFVHVVLQILTSSVHLVGAIKISLPNVYTVHNASCISELDAMSMR